MIDKRLILGFGLVVAGTLAIVSATAHPPAGGCPIGVTGDPGSVHLDSDGTLDYYDNCRLYPGAALVFLSVTGIGVALVGVGGWSLWKYRS